MKERNANFRSFDYQMFGGIPKVEITSRLQSVKRKLKRFILYPNMVLLVFLMTGVLSGGGYSEESLARNMRCEHIECTEAEYIYSDAYSEYMYIKERLEDDYFRTRETLYDDIDGYVSRITEKHELNIYYIIDMCVLHNYDILLLLSQAQLESHFGTKGEATSTKSMFNVIWSSFENKNDSVEPYISLINRRYLSDGRTSKDLLKNFTDIYGHRYAEDKRYETKLREIYGIIESKTEIGKTMNELKNIDNELTCLNKPESSPIFNL